MKISRGLLANFLLASTVLAAPGALVGSPVELGTHSPTERDGRERESPMLSPQEFAHATNESHLSYTPGWAGAVWDTYPTGTFATVTGTFIVPVPTGSDGAASVWVGLDGYTCQNAILQAGINIHMLNGVSSYDAWYEWYPDSTSFISNMAISARDVIRLTVIATSPNSGKAVVENLSTGITITKSLSSSHALCQANAEWIVEDYLIGKEQVSFCNFGTIEFTDAVAKTANGRSADPNGARVLAIEQNGRVLTSTREFPGGVTIQRS